METNHTFDDLSHQILEHRINIITQAAVRVLPLVALAASQICLILTPSPILSHFSMKFPLYSMLVPNEKRNVHNHCWIWLLLHRQYKLRPTRSHVRILLLYIIWYTYINPICWSFSVTNHLLGDRCQFIVIRFGWMVTMPVLATCVQYKVTQFRCSRIMQGWLVLSCLTLGHAGEWELFHHTVAICKGSQTFCFIGQVVVYGHCKTRTKALPSSITVAIQPQISYNIVNSVRWKLQIYNQDAR